MISTIISMWSSALERKMKEAMLALAAERRLRKEEIVTAFALISSRVVSSAPSKRVL